MAGRNALTQPRSMQMAAAPMEQEPPQQMPVPQGYSPEMLMQEAKRVGYQGDNPEEAAAVLWQASPTDDVGEMIEAVSQATGMRPPWQQQQPPAGGMMRRGY
jgi:hypothetical protein